MAATYHQHARDDELRAACPGLVALANEATDEADTQSVAARVVAELGGLYVLVNNVGGMVARVPFEQMTQAHWRAVMKINLDSMFLMTKAVLGDLADGWRVVDINGGAYFA